MGYYSRVAIGMLKDDAAKMVGEFNKAFPDMPMEEMGMGFYLLEGKDHTVIYWEEIKWYTDTPEYKEVIWIMNYLHSLSEDIPYLLIEAGEDMGDLREEYNAIEGENWTIHDTVMFPSYGVDFCQEFKTLWNEKQLEAIKPLVEWKKIKLFCPNCGKGLEDEYINSYGFNKLADNKLTVWHYCSNCKKELEIEFNLIFNNSKVLEENTNAN